MTIDKNYFKYEGSVPQELRRQFSDLTNLVLKCLDGYSQSENAMEALEQILEHPRYQHSEDRLLSLSVDLSSVCHYWEESWRFDHCWPEIEKLAKNSRLL